MHCRGVAGGARPADHDAACEDPAGGCGDSRCRAAAERQWRLLQVGALLLQGWHPCGKILNAVRQQSANGVYCRY
jgi:hypothetical protein